MRYTTNKEMSTSNRAKAITRIEAELLSICDRSKKIVGSQELICLLEARNYINRAIRYNWNKRNAPTKTR